MRCIGSQTIEVMQHPELMRRDEELQTSKGRETIYKKIEKSKCLVNNSLPDHSEIMRHREILTSRIGQVLPCPPYLIHIILQLCMVVAPFLEWALQLNSFRQLGGGKKKTSRVFCLLKAISLKYPTGATEAHFGAANFTSFHSPTSDASSRVPRAPELLTDDLLRFENSLECLIELRKCHLWLQFFF